MNKALESWIEVKDYLNYILYDIGGTKALNYTSTSGYLQPFIDNVETEIKRLEELEKEFEMEHTLRIRLENIVYEKSEVLRIIKEKRVNVNLLVRYKTVKGYNDRMGCHQRHLTQAEFDLLKEWLE